MGGRGEMTAFIPSCSFFLLRHIHTRPLPPKHITYTHRTHTRPLPQTQYTSTYIPCIHTHVPQHTHVQSPTSKVSRTSIPCRRPCPQKPSCTSSTRTGWMRTSAWASWEKSSTLLVRVDSFPLFLSLSLSRARAPSLFSSPFFLPFRG